MCERLFASSVKQVDRGSEKGLPKISMHNVLSSCAKHPYNYVYIELLLLLVFKEVLYYVRGGVEGGGGGIKMLYYNTPS